MNPWRRVALVLCLLAAAPGCSHPSQTEITRPATPHDAKSNDPRVPEAMATSGAFKRIFVFRFKYQADLLAGIEALVQEHKIDNAVILSGIGSVRNYHLHAVSNREFPSKNIFTKDSSAPADLVSVNGYVFGGRVHAHATLADSDRALGGHLEPGTHVFTFAIITLAELTEEADVSRFDDKTYR